MDKLENSRKKNLKPLYFVIGIMLLIAIWEIIYLSTTHNTFPEFFTSLYEMIKLMGKAEAWIALGYTFFRLVVSLAVSILLGTTFGLIASYFPPLESILKPLIYIITCFPTASLIFVLIIYTKITSYLLVFIITFPIMYKAVLGGGKIILKKYKDPISTEGRYSLSNLIRVVLPLSLPYIFIGMAQSIGLGFKVEIMGEVFMTSWHFIGIGKLINEAYINLEMLELFGLTFFAILTIVILDTIIYFIKRWLFNKYGTEPVKVFSLK
ncbi:MAG: ABC transporter permease subunit [Bacilli bacterium]